MSSQTSSPEIETKDMDPQNEIALANAMLDRRMANLQIMLTCKLEEVNRHENELVSQKNDCANLQKEITLLSERVTKAKHNINILKQQKQTLLEVEKNLQFRLQSLAESTTSMARNHEDILGKYRKVLEDYREIYSSLPEVGVRNKLKKENQILQIQKAILAQACLEENKKQKIFKEINKKRTQAAIVSLAEAHVEMKRHWDQKKEKEEKLKKLKDEILLLENRKKQAVEKAAENAKEAVAKVKERTEKYKQGVFMLQSTAALPPNHPAMGVSSSPLKRPLCVTSFPDKEETCARALPVASFSPGSFKKTGVPESHEAMDTDQGALNDNQSPEKSEESPKEPSVEMSPPRERPETTADRGSCSETPFKAPNTSSESKKRKPVPKIAAPKKTKKKSRTDAARTNSTIMETLKKAVPSTSPRQVPAVIPDKTDKTACKSQSNKASSTETQEGSPKIPERRA